MIYKGGNALYSVGIQSYRYDIEIYASCKNKELYVYATMFKLLYYFQYSIKSTLSLVFQKFKNKN